MLRSGECSSNVAGVAAGCLLELPTISVPKVGGTETKWLCGILVLGVGDVSVFLVGFLSLVCP